MIKKPTIVAIEVHDKLKPSLIKNRSFWTWGCVALCKLENTPGLGYELQLLVLLNSSLYRLPLIDSYIKKRKAVTSCWLSAKERSGAPLVVQWIRLCLPVQGTQVRFLLWEDPTCPRATKPMQQAPEPTCCNCWSPRSPHAYSPLPHKRSHHSEKSTQGNRE